MNKGTISPTAKVLFTGNSITAGTPGIWYTNAVGSLNATFAPQVLSTVNTGVGSTGIAAIASAIPTRITNFNPTHVVVEIGINDITVLGTTLPTYLADMSTIVAACVAAGIPAANIWWLEIGLYGEAWNNSGPGGTPAFDNFYDPTINSWNASIATQCASLGINFVPLRAALLASAVVNNPTGLLTNGVLTLSTGGPNPHPNTTLGQPIWSAQWLATVNAALTTTVNTHPISQINFSGLRVWTVGDSIARGVADGVGELAGCGWRNLLAIAFATSKIFPIWVGTLNDGYGCTSCPENGAQPLHDCPSGDPTCANLQASLAGWFAAIGGFDVMILEAGTRDVENDALNHTNLAPAAFDSLLAACVALEPGARFFVSNLPPSPNILTVGTTFAAHVASEVASYAGGGTKMVLVDHFNGIPPQGSSLTLDQTTIGGNDFSSGNVHVAGPGGAVVSPPSYGGFPKMSAITYLTMTHAAP